MVLACKCAHAAQLARIGGCELRKSEPGRHTPGDDGSALTPRGLCSRVLLESVDDWPMAKFNSKTFGGKP
jgi:hypothetical protein